MARENLVRISHEFGERKRKEMSNDRTTEILNYLSAISREVGDMRTEMKARFQSIETEMKTRFQSIEADIKEIKYDFRIVREDLRHSRKEIEELKDRVEVLEGK